jgi:DNA polymerase III sliding clamp (beta) subunit (PCNA family)
MNEMVNRAKLLSVLNLVKPAIAAKDYVPILTHFMFDGESVTAYNDILAINLECDVKIQGCIPADLLIKSLNSIKTEEVSLLRHDNHVMLTSGKTKIKLPVLQSADFPTTLSSKSKLISTLKVTDKMLEGIQKCLMAVGVDFNHPAQMGVTLDPAFSRTECALYSTDNVTISRYVFTSNGTIGSNAHMIMPTMFCQQLVALSKRYGSAEIETYAGALVARFGCEAILFTKTLVDMQPMPFDTIIGKYADEDKLKLINTPDIFHESFERAVLVQENELSKSTDVIIENGKLLLESQSNKGEVADEMQYAGDSMHFTIDPSLVKRVASMADKIAILRRVMVFMDKDQNYLHLIAHKNN